jgi:cyclophilin family peptidyl-prolyl cis-trans isomerase
MNKPSLIIVSSLVLLTGVGFYMSFIYEPKNDSVKSVVQNQNNKVVLTDEQAVNEQKPIEESQQQNTNINTQTKMENFSHIVTIKTNKGVIKFKTYDADAPNTVNNFITLAGKKFYDGVIFHRVIPGFMIQGGDPTGTGMGGPGYKFADELSPDTVSAKNGYRKGVVAMANSGPNTNGSQFFIMVSDYPLPHSYTIFGEVIEGQEVADAISKADRSSSDKPLSAITMESVTFEEAK